MKEINLKEILVTIFEPSSQDCTTPIQDLQLAITLNPDLNKILRAMRAACNQTINLCVENAYASVSYDEEDDTYNAEISKESILKTKDQII